MSSDTKSNRSLLILFSVVVLDLIGFGVVVPILPFYASQYGASATVLGILLTCYSAMQFLFSPVWGKLSDRFGRKKIMLFTLAGSSLSLLFLGQADSLAMIFVGRILSGIFAANISVASAYVTDVTTEENRTKAMGLIGAAFGVGFLLGPAMGGILSPRGYHVPILTASALTFLNLLYTAWRLPEPQRHHHVGPAIPKTAVLSHRPVARLCFLYFLFSLSITQLESVFAFFMMDKFNYDAIHVSYILAMMALIMILVQGGFIRPMSKKYGEKALFLAGSLILCGSFFFIPGSVTVPLLLVPLAFSGLGRGIAQPSMLSLVSQKAPAHMRGAVMGTFQASASLGRVVGPIMAGALYDYWQPAPFYAAGILMAATFFLSIGD